MLDTNSEIEDELKLTADVLEDDPHDAGTFVPVVAHKISEEATISKSDKLGLHTPSMWCLGPRVEMLRSTRSALHLVCLPDAVPHWCG